MNLRYVIMNRQNKQIAYSENSNAGARQIFERGTFGVCWIITPGETATFVLKHTSPSGERRIYIIIMIK
jgi:hypothetical protein